MATNPDELDPKARPPQLGMMLTPEQQRQQRIDADMQRASQRIQETRQGFKNAAGAVGGALGTAAGAVIKAGTVVPRTIAGMATGEIPVTVSHLPDYRNKGVEQRRAANWVKNNPEQADAARVGMRAVADRASSAAIGQVKSAQPTKALGMAAAGKPAVSLNAPAQAGPAAPAATASDAGPAAPAATASDAGPQAQPGLGFQRTSVDGVVGRVGANGVPEFSNAPNDVSSASDSQMTAGRMGNGVGGLSVGEAGDSALAMERYGRANEIRAGTNRLRRQGELGDTGNFTVVRDSTRSPTFAELQNDRLDRADQRRNDAVGADQADRALRSQELEARLGFNDRKLANQERELSNAERTGELERQRLDMDLEAGQLSLKQQRQVQQLREQLADPNLDPATREQIQRAYNTLTTPAKDRYMLQDVVMGQDALGAPVFGKAALDVTTGQLVGQGQQGGQAPAAQFQAGKIYKDAAGNRARYKGTDAQGNPQWEHL